MARDYRLDGLLLSQAFPSAITETLAYDAVKRPVSISLGSAGSISQGFDRAGRVTSDGRSPAGFSGDAGTGTQSFSYDNASRLTGSSGLAVSRAYQYDLDGNRTSRVEGATTTTFTYDRADQVTGQVIGGTSRTFDYDRYGNLLGSADNASAVTTYAYDEASRLLTISPPGGASTQVTFTLDALDRHATRLVNAVTTDTYAYLDASETAWGTGTGTPTASLLDATGTRLAVKTGSTVSWLLFDPHGSVAALSSTSGSLTDAYRYDGWGQQIASAGSAVNPFRYRGLLNIGADALTGALLDMGARDYLPQLGQFTQEDSVQGSAANPLTMNRFLYALANPATLIDPDGHRACMDMGADGCQVSPDLDQEVAQRRAEANRPVPPPRSVAPIDETIGFMGYNPWELDRDPTFRAIWSSLYANCTTGFDPGCDDVVLLADWQSRNKELYCSFHRAECDNGLARELHDTLGALGMVPFIGVVFDGADMLLYIAEGDGGGSLLALGSMIPIVGDAGRAGKMALSHADEAAGATTKLGLPRDALGRFTSGAGGESAATAAGRNAHGNYSNTLGGGDYVFNRSLPGSRLRPDAVSYSQNIVRELKPGNSGAIARGWRQVNAYKAYLEGVTGQQWTAYVDVYTP